MARTLFDLPAPPRPVTLVRLAGEMARAVAGIGRVAVEGEVHRPTTSRGGWVFFTLRDRTVQLDVKVPRGNARRSRVVAGERVCVVGSLEWTPDRGHAYLVAEEVTPVGAGAVAALIAETRARLAAEGLLDRPKRPLPLLPGAIAVVCGADAAVRRDIESVVAARFPGYPVVFEETTVTGPGAALGIVEALRVVAGRPGVGVVVLARGGGDAPSLLPWSSDEVCRAVAACAVPVVSAIGHEGDRPLCDEVADLRCGTPSMAAAAVVPEREALVGTLGALRQRAADATRARLEAGSRRLATVDTGRSLRTGLERADTRLGRAGERLRFTHPRHQLERCRARLAAPEWRRAVGEVLGQAAGRLAAEERHLRALSPARTLERGYAVVSGPDGTVLRDAASVATGAPLTIRLATGRLGATVTEVHER